MAAAPDSVRSCRRDFDYNDTSGDPDPGKLRYCSETAEEHLRWNIRNSIHST